MTKMALAVFIFFGIVFSSPVHAQQNLAQRPCYSDRGGYCIKIVAPKSPQKDASAGFAIVGLEFLGESADLGDLLANLYYFLFGQPIFITPSGGSENHISSSLPSSCFRSVFFSLKNQHGGRFALSFIQFGRSS